MDTAQATLVVLVATLIVFFWYAWLTRRLAMAAEKTLESSLRMLQLQREATLAPVLEQHIERTPQAILGSETTVEVLYKNVGSGPAVSIVWQLFNEQSRAVSELQERNGMAPDAPERPVEFEIGTDLFRGGRVNVVAEYESVLGVIWRSALPLQTETELSSFPDSPTYFLANDSSGVKIERLQGRMIRGGPTS